MKYLFSIIVLSSIFIFGCKNEPDGITSSIEGRFPKMTGQKITLEELEVRKTIPIDSIIIDEKGQFQFVLAMDDAGFFILKTSEENILLLQLEKGENIKLISENELFEEGYQISGSSGSQLLLDFNQFMNLQRQRIDSIAALYYEARSKKDFIALKTELDSAYETIVNHQRTYIQKFVKTHTASLVNLFVINRSLGQNQVLDEEQDFKLLHTIDSALMINYPNNKHSLDHHKRVKEIQGRIFDKRVAEEKVKPGKSAPDIVLNDTAGNPVSLKSYSGHPTIVQFWAGWNAQSRLDNQNLTKLYPELQSKGVKVLGVSLDENSVVWKGAVKLDSLQWQQVSDLQGMRSEIAKSYNLPDELPFYYLLDENQKIMFKNSSVDSVLIHLDQLFLQSQ